MVPPDPCMERCLPGYHVNMTSGGGKDYFQNPTGDRLQMKRCVWVREISDAGCSASGRHEYGMRNSRLMTGVLNKLDRKQISR